MNVLMLIILNGSALLAKPDDINNTTWQQKSDLIQNYPVICATNFEHMVQLFIEDVLNRGYYMAAWGYEFYLRVLQVSLTSERIVLFIFEMMKKWSPTGKPRMLCNMKQDMKVMKNKS